MQIGVLFSGQGAQKPGMGVDFLGDPLFCQLVEEASQATGLNIATLMKGEGGELDYTKYVQPALVTVSYGIYRMLERDLQLPIAGMVGLSLGEYAALMAARALDFTPGMALLADRARYMQEDADQVPSTLAAIVEPKLDVVSQAVEAAQAAGQGVYFANYNSPDQVVLGGAKEALEQVVEEITAKEAAKKAVVLKVSGAFHTQFFNGARQKMTERLKTVAFHTPTVPVISNTTVTPFEKEGLADVLARQLAVPTHFGDDLAYLINHQGVDTTLEIGPGKTLTRFAKQVDRKLTRYRISSLADYQAFVKEVSDGTQG